MATDFQSLPIIDISALVKDGATAEEKKKVGDELTRACREVGFFYVKGHGVSQEFIDGVFKIVKEFFDKPAEEKKKIKMNAKSFPRGYQALGENVTQYQKDWHEAIDLYREGEVKDNSPGAKTFAHPNLWPSDPSSFEPTIKKYIEEMKELGKQIMQGVALGLNLEPNFFVDNYTNDTFWVMRIIGYPPLSSANGNQEVGVSCGEHTDYGWLTIVNQDATEGALRVQNVKGEWITAEPIPGTFVMNIGDMLKVWSNGTFQSTKHKVINEGKRYRISIPFFYEPNFEALIEPHSLFVDEKNEAKFKGIKYGDHLLTKVLNNFDPEAVK
eukprot:TRINITY_DN1848_c0_g1_i2.p1 TRINITY_DN1848_c0_g1~~TRINITY_DN1848_c0_g1_i2.p1  ORF type:complete len:351 (-),score=115.65 TRINITY_DN1848_c0_g1_i2:108-1088(-)